MNENDLLRLIRSRKPNIKQAALLVGMGDDCAVFRPRGFAADWLITTDMLIEGAHFHRQSHPARAVGHRALARGLSDIAAMGGRPSFCLLSLALPAWADSRWVGAFLKGFGDLARRTRTALAGGDLARAKMFACDIVVIGEAPPGAALQRDGARPGDAIYVSGALGGAALGLRSGRGTAWKTHLYPEPRLSLGMFLHRKLKATAAMDLSDGLSLDLHRLALASGVSAVIDREPPAFRGATLEDVLHGGEDYELLFTLPPRTVAPAEFEGVPITRIGCVRQGRPGRATFQGRPLAPRGWDHFRDR